MSKRSIVTGILAALLVVCAAREAAADGVLLAPSQIPSQARGSLLTEISKSKGVNPTAFEAVASVRKQLPELDANKRGRFAPITPMLKSIGPEGIFAMLEHVAVNAPARGDLTETAWSAWRVGLLEAIGTLRDPRSAPVLTAILDGSETDFMIVKAAAEALGKLGTDGSVQKLLALAKTGPKSKAVLAGMGHCRRAAVAEALSKVIAQKPEAETARLVLRSLGDVGSAAAWATSIVQVSGEEAATRAAAAKALVGAFVAYEGDLRQLAQGAILVVDDPSTTSLIESAKKGAPASVLAALDKLAAKLAKNPTR